MSQMKLKGSSKRWLKEHHNDKYVKQAKELGYRSRAAFKLLEMQAKDKIIEEGAVVVDLGAAPGGWSQVAVELVGQKGKVIALDILSMDTIAGVEFLQGDFTEDEVYKKLLGVLDDARDKVDVVLSDMAPNMSGIKQVDQLRAMNLVELAADFACENLQKHGVFVVKIFHGIGFDDFVKDMRKKFVSVKIRKPDASRDRSNEVYLIARDPIF
ncbi:MAG: 23S rRNA (uridine(2552)-2'-O)-methyltransferase RlmE [Gammaproteobacteria bacterium]|nr:23S rRNA (uridine(2552)-2'-O)-methyltransferase RlmE [Gammaproteobacteria bacterium]